MKYFFRTACMVLLSMLLFVACGDPAADDEKKDKAPPAPVASSAAELIGFKVGGETAVVDPSDPTKFTVVVLTSTDVTSLDITELVTSTGATLTAPALLTDQDFSSQVTFTVTAEDKTTTKNYTVTVKATGVNTAAELTSFNIDGVAAVIDPTDASKFTVTIPNNRNVASLDVTDVMKSAGSTLTAPASLTGLDFTNPMTFTVTAADGMNTKSYTVSVSATAPSDAAELISLQVGGMAAGLYPGSNRFFVTIPAPVDASNNVTSLVDMTSLDITAPMISAGATLAPTSLTGLDFSNGVPLTVTAEDGTTTKDYSIFAIPQLPFFIPVGTQLSVPSSAGGGTTTVTRVNFQYVNGSGQLRIYLDGFPKKIAFSSVDFQIVSGFTITNTGDLSNLDLNSVANIFNIFVEGPDNTSRTTKLVVDVVARTGVDFKIGAGQTVAQAFVEQNPTTIGDSEANAIRIGDQFGEITTSDDPYTLAYTASPGATVEAKIPPSTTYEPFASGDTVASFTEIGKRIDFKVTSELRQIRHYYVTVKKPSTAPDVTAVAVTVAGTSVAANIEPTRAIDGLIIAPGANFSALPITVTTSAPATAVTANGVALAANGNTYTGTVNASTAPAGDLVIIVEGTGSAAPKQYTVHVTERPPTFLNLISDQTKYPQLSKFKELVDAVTDTNTKNHFTNQVTETLFAPTNTVIDTYLAAPTGTVTTDAAVVGRRFAELKTNQAMLAEFLKSFIVYPSVSKPGGALKLLRADMVGGNIANDLVSLAYTGTNFGKRFVQPSFQTVFFTSRGRLSINPFDQQTVNGVVHIVEGKTTGGANGNIRDVFNTARVSTPLAAIN